MSDFMGKIYCTECGTELEDTVKFCSGCGSQVDNGNINTNSKEAIDNNNLSNKDSVEIKEKSKTSINRKYLAGIIIAIIIISILGFVIITVSSPLYSSGYTVDSSDYSIHSDKGSRPSFDDEFAGSNVRFYEKYGNGEIEVWHHGANGHDVDYYLKQYSTYDKDTSGTPAWRHSGVDYGVKIKHTNNITVDGVKGYIMDGTWGVGAPYTWVILVHDDEYYLICFDHVNQEHQNKFLNSFKFKDN